MGEAATESPRSTRSTGVSFRRPGDVILAAGAALSLLCVHGRVAGQTETSAWLHRAAALQRYIGYDIPLDRITLTATHNSFSTDRNISTHANFEVVTAQVYSMTDQLSCLGVRGIELDLHYIEELAEEGDEESAIRLCHASEDVAEQIWNLCENTFGWDLCEAADISDYGEDTGCRSGAPTAREGFEEVAAWLFLEENANEVIFIKLDSALNGENETVSSIVADVFGEDVIFSPDDWEQYSGSEEWPSPAELVSAGTRVVIAGLEPSTLVFSTYTDAVEERIAALDFESATCGETEDFPEPSWHRVQGTEVVYRLESAGSIIFELAPDSEEALTAFMTPNVMNCGFTPTFDRLDAELMESTVWSWDTDRPETGFEQPRAAVISVVGGRWTDVDSNSDGGERHSYACRDPDVRHDWVVVPVDTNNSISNSNSNSTSTSASSLRRSRRSRRKSRRNRRKLATSTSGSGYGYDGEGGEADDEYGAEEEEMEYGVFSGEFSEADDACGSIEDGFYIFGAPRTAYENAWLRLVMQEAEVDTVWIDHVSPGDELGSSTCWTHEGGSEYCVDTSNNTCADVADPVTEIADGELPTSQVAEWQNETYDRPAYTISGTVESLNGWARVAGNNEFDLTDSDYVVGIILAAVPVFVFGFIVACCCLPVGHIAAGSKEHHVDGRGFFGCFCPSRCKRGDFMGSGTLAVVVCFTILTILGGVAAIYGVRSVDGEIVDMVSSLKSIGDDMSAAQTGVQSLYDLLTNVEESFEGVSSCHLFSSLDGIQAGIESAKVTVQETIEDDELGSVSRDILELEESFSSTQATRRAIVYLAGVLVLVMSAIYVSVGYYALGKDGGRGKDGAARVRGPVVIGCMILPVSLLVILLCWFLFGVSTSVALLTSDFCISPSEHATEAFSKPADREIVAFYTSCEGPNTFSDQLATAYLQAVAAQGLLDAVDDEVLAADCPDDVESMQALDDDIAAILAQVDTLGYLVQCSRINPYFVNGIEGSLCNDAPPDIWFVIGGFAVMPIGLFIVAVAFRLLLQQKEEGLYKVVFEDEIAVSETSLSDFGGSDDSWSRAHDSKNDTTEGASGKNLYRDDTSERARAEGAAAGGGGGPSFADGHGVAAVTAGAWGPSRLPQRQHVQQQQTAMGVDAGYAPRRSKPVELAVPLARSGGTAGAAAAADGKHGSRSPAVAAGINSSSGDGEGWGQGRRGEHQGAIAQGMGQGRGGSGVVPSWRSRRSIGRGGLNDTHYRGTHHDDFASQGGRLKSTRLFRSLAGLDDPADEAPAVIVSRHASRRPTRNLGGADMSGGTTTDNAARGPLAVAIGRPSSVVRNSTRRNHAAACVLGEGSDMDVGSSDSDGHGGGGGASKSKKGRVSNGRSSGGSGRKSGRLSSGAGVEGPTSHGTWATFSRDCARRHDAPTLISRNGLHDFGSRNGRKGVLGYDGIESKVSDAVAPRFEARRGAVGGSHGVRVGGADDTLAGFPAENIPSPGSSTVSGLTGWRRQRLQQRVASRHSSQRAAKDSARSWNKGAEEGGGREAATAATVATKTGIKGLSSLARPSSTEAAKASRVGERMAVAVTGTRPAYTSPRSGKGVSSGQGTSSRPGTRIQDALNGHGGIGRVSPERR